MVIIFVRLAIGKIGWYGDDDATQSWGMAIAPLPWTGHAKYAPLRVVVVVVDGGTVVVVVVVVVVLGTVEVVEVVDEVVVGVVVVVADVVVVVDVVDVVGPVVTEQGTLDDDVATA